MVDRYRSFLDEKIDEDKKNNSSILIQSQVNQYDKHIRAIERHGNTMRNYIINYRQATTPDEENSLIQKYKQEQRRMKEVRQKLVREYRDLQNQKDPNHQSQMLFIKQHLLKTVQKELKLDVEINEIIEGRQKQRQTLANRLIPGSQQLNNALNDIKQKRNQIMYLDQSVKQCVNLLQIIGILVLEQGQKIKITRQNVQKANELMQLSLQKIEIAKVRSQRSTNRKCCIIVLGLIIIIIILVAMGLFMKWF